MALRGSAENIVSLIPNDLIRSENGCKLILEKLDALFLPDKFEKCFWPYRALKLIQRAPNVKIRDFIIQFEQTYLEFESVNSSLPDTIVGYDLLTACMLTKSQIMMVKAALGNDDSYKNMKATLKRMFAEDDRKESESPLKNDSDIIEDKTFYLEEKSKDEATGSDTLYAAGRRPYRGRGGTFRNNRGGRSNRRNFRPYDRHRINPVGRDGKPSTCVVCRSIYHYVRECPNASEKNYDKDRDNSHPVKFTCFVGCTADQENNKIQELVDETRGHAILDSGCSNTVCGEHWMSKFIENLSDEERGMIKIKPSSQTFTFGDGKTVRSKRKVTIPCWMGGTSGEITTDVVDCNIPLLLSRRSMKAVGFILYFKKDEVIVNNRHIKLKVTKSGHYALPISL